MKHIDTTIKNNCCGCGACAEACPKKCISISEDVNGFLYPVIQADVCVNCSKCVSVCPFLNAETTKNQSDDLLAYAFVSHDDELIRTSSSSGAFSVIANELAKNNKDNFCIVGAAFNGINVVHICAEDLNGIKALKKSKYVQSDTRDIWLKIKEKLENGKSVLFSGTPCQVAALKTFLGKDYENLLTIDIVCHGVPNQKIFSDYISELSQINNKNIQSAEFRVKRNFDTQNPNPRTLSVNFENGETLNMDIEHSEYLYGFHTGMYMRPSCYSCKFSTPERVGDITLADYWGIEKLHPELQSKRGVSLVRFNTEKGKKYAEVLSENGKMIETQYEFACKENYQLLKPSTQHRNYDKFFKLRRKGLSVMDAVNVCKRPDTIFAKVVRKLKRIVKR